MEVERAGKRAPRRQTPGAGCPRLGTTTAMFVGRNGRKRKPSQGMGVPTYYVFSRYFGQVRPVAEKERPVVTGKRELPLPNVGEVVFRFLAEKQSRCRPQLQWSDHFVLATILIVYRLRMATRLSCFLSIFSQKHGFYFPTDGFLLEQFA